MFPQGPISTVYSKMILSDTLVTGLWVLKKSQVKCWVQEERME